MRPSKGFLRLLATTLALVCLFAKSSFAQATSVTPPVHDAQAVSYLQKSVAAMLGSVSLSDVILTGNAQRFAGIDSDSGPATLQALATGASHAKFSLASGEWTEVADVSSVPSGSWSGPDGAAHKVTFHNLIVEPVWFFPAIVLARRVSQPSFVATYIGTEQRNGQTVHHLSVYENAPFPNPSKVVTYEHLTTMEIYLSTSTLLPSSITFNIHPDNNALLDIPIEVEFSDYRSTNGVQVPFHIQKFANNSLQLDFQASSVTFNNGLSTNIFASQTL